MSIWAKQLTKEDINQLFQELPTLMKHLEIEITEITPDSLSARMPVDGKTKQIHGILHGGASAALAETVGSIASHLAIEGEEKISVGVELNINHLKAVHEGTITATAKPIRLGSTLQVWEIRIVNDTGDLTAISRLTMMVLNKALQPKHKTGE